MKVIVAESAGACFGVNRSIDLCLKASGKGKHVATLGQLIHNPQTIVELAEKYQVFSVSSVRQAAENDVHVLVIRSHGVPIEIKETSQQYIQEVIDATCPFVKHVQKTASELALKYGQVVIVGQSDHPEVEGVKSYVERHGGKCFVAQTPQEVAAIAPLIDKKHKVGVVSQTTQNIETFNNTVKCLKSAKIKVDVNNTICTSTSDRQKAAEALSKKCDAVVVVGGHNSANTNHLTQICKKNCNNVYHIENIDELDLDQIVKFEKVGVTGGASTPKHQINDIVLKLKSLQ